MRRLLCPGVGALLLVAAVLPRPGSADHPLDPGATPGVLSVDDPFADRVPLLDRETPAPSFVTAPVADTGRSITDAGAPGIEPAMNHGEHAGHGGMLRGARHTTTEPAE